MSVEPKIKKEAEGELEATLVEIASLTADNAKSIADIRTDRMVRDVVLGAHDRIGWRRIHIVRRCVVGQVRLRSVRGVK